MTLTLHERCKNDMKKLRITQKEAVQIYKNVGLILLEEYKGSKYKHLCQDGDGYRYTLSLDCVKDKRTKKFSRYSKNNLYTVYNLKNFIKENNLRCSLIEDDTRIVTEKDKLRFLCGNCGKEYFLHYNHLLSYKKDTCNKCSYQSFGDKNRLTKEDYNELLKSTNYSLIEGIEPNYRQIHIKDNDGYKYIATFPNIYSGTTPIKFHKHNPYTIENMKLFLSYNNFPVKLLENDNKNNFDTRSEYLKFSCIECGREYEATWNQVVHNYRYRCPNCTKHQSKYEHYVEQYLLEKNVEYIRQKRFEACRNIKPLPFDFYLPKYNYIIEVHGEQHYYENDVFHETLEHRQYIDKIKEDYCKENNINFVAIPYWLIVNNHAIKRYKEIIDSIISQD